MWARVLQHPLFPEAVLAREKARNRSLAAAPGEAAERQAREMRKAQQVMDKLTDKVKKRDARIGELRAELDRQREEGKRRGEADARHTLVRQRLEARITQLEQQLEASRRGFQAEFERLKEAMERKLSTTTTTTTEADRVVINEELMRSTSRFVEQAKRVRNRIDIRRRQEVDELDDADIDVHFHVTTDP